MTDNQLCELVNRVFAGVPRPEHFTNYTHCSECQEHDELMRSRNPDTLLIEDVGNSGWDPVCFLTPQGYLYYFPAFVRLTFDRSGDSYLSQFLLFLPQAKDSRFSLFNKKQRQAVLTFLYHVRDQHKDYVLSCGYDTALESAIGAWESVVKR